MSRLPEITVLADLIEQNLRERTEPSAIPISAEPNTGQSSTRTVPPAEPDPIVDASPPPNPD